MAQYEIKDVVCDYGIYEDGELILILDSAHNAHLIKRILEIDQSVPNSAIPADFVEVVRCKDCIHKVDFMCRVMCSRNAQKHGDEYYHLTATNNEHFCSYGERKENERTID